MEASYLQIKENQPKIKRKKEIRNRNRNRRRKRKARMKRNIGILRLEHNLNNVIRNIDGHHCNHPQ